MTTVKLCPGCERCHDAAHHLVSDIDSAGQPVFACKHCTYVLEVDWAELDDILPETTLDAINFRANDSTYYWLDADGQYRRCVWCAQIVRRGDNDPEVCVCDRGRCLDRSSGLARRFRLRSAGAQTTIQNTRYF